jgi:hypothetical protein
MKMKKNKLTNLLKLGFFLFGISLLLWNCEKENLTEEKIEFNSKFKVSLISYKEIDTNLKLKEKLAKLSKTKNSLAKSIYSSEHNFTIDTDLAKYVESNNGNYHSYTFKVIREQYYGALENLLVSLQSDGSYKLFLIKYQLTPAGNEIDKQQNPSVEIIEDEEITNNLFARCEMEFKCAQPCNYGYCHYQGPAPDCTGALYEVSITCSGGGGPVDNGTGAGTSAGDEGTGGGSNSGGTSTSNPPSNVTSPFTKPTKKDPLLEIEMLNFGLSTKSPFNVDMTQVLDSINLPANDSIKIANQKFLCLYKKLTTSNTFKNLFTNVFGDSQDVLNIEFKITKDLLHDGEKANGLRTVLPGGTTNSITGKITKLNQLIEIDQGLLNGESNYNAIKTIIHESIHAYLTLKKLDCTTFTSFDQYNNDDICETINTYYSNFSCNGNQGQHEFMFDYMLPTFKIIYGEIGMLNFMTQGNINGLNDNYDLQYLNNPNDPNGINIINSHILDWDEFHFYNTLPGLHNTEVFKNEIENNPTKKELYKAYRYVGQTYLEKNCN